MTTLESVKFGFSMFSQVELNLFTSLINTTNQEVFNIPIQSTPTTDKRTDNNCNLVI